ncbi:hypothetical protein [Streptomyces sp. NPDC050355]|uniref:hypothetical protein n=1 Tax=Streptomyces sp. NPDC050355 TaxID=3365609 RepID=UPI0037AE0D3C
MTDFLEALGPEDRQWMESQDQDTQNKILDFYDQSKPFIQATDFAGDAPGVDGYAAHEAVVQFSRIR